MLSVRVQKDIGEYTEKIVGKLSARTLACLAGGLASAVGAAALCQFALGIEVRDAALAGHVRIPCRSGSRGSGGPIT